ncbi:formate dehydrogenase subunit gamma [Thermoflexus sp.]|uniref:formate dehydrogenase subunit gamma n=1 Tax=Thermoflexus sp. TaxID=1969742 RepID=UPI002ADDFC47|nr:cytochrome b/b6 domain-containing protein [Thermoflexus sp.]MCS7252200.1 cytochrome b/b6 domain-containing protein [Thermoflexus sp.]
MAHQATRLVLRYRLGQRLVHWIHTVAFFILLITGLALIWPPLSFLAAGGLSRLLHRVAGVVFLLTPVLYALMDFRGLRDLVRDSFTYTRRDLEWLKGFPGYFLGRTSHLPPQGRINAGQKIHHALTIISYFAISGSGLLLWLAKGSLGPTGLLITTIVHDLSMAVMAVLTVGHIYFTLVYDALPAMTTGYVTEGYARMEHRLWLESLPQEPPYVIETRGIEMQEAVPESSSTPMGEKAAG